jgi:GGDEF domain-containing protein
MDNHEFWSCKDLQGSLYLAPSQVRACCQRFFVDGKQQGDVVLLDTEKGDLVTIESISHAKNDLIRKINEKERTPCFQCPYLEKKKWDKKEILEMADRMMYHAKSGGRGQVRSTKDILKGV